MTTNETFLAILYRPENFDDLMHRLRLIETHNSTSQGLGFVRHIWVKLFANVQNVYAGEHKLNTHHLPGILLNAWTSGPTSCYYTGPDRAACWISLDIYMENAMDGKNLQPLSAIEVLTGACHMKDFIITTQIYFFPPWVLLFVE